MNAAAQHLSALLQSPAFEDAKTIFVDAACKVFPLSDTDSVASQIQSCVKSTQLGPPTTFPTEHTPSVVTHMLSPVEQRHLDARLAAAVDVGHRHPDYHALRSHTKRQIVKNRGDNGTHHSSKGKTISVSQQDDVSLLSDYPDDGGVPWAQ